MGNFLWGQPGRRKGRRVGMVGMAREGENEGKET